MTEKKFRGRACGKFILLGEHFVAHGQSAIAFPVKSFYCQADVDFMSHSEMARAGKLNKTLEALLKALSLDAEGKKLKVSSQSNFPTSRGFGSSASFSTALLRALTESKVPEETVALEILQSMEKVYHMSPSGVDAATIWREEPLFFKMGQKARTIQNKIADFILVDAGTRKGTAELVKSVRGFKNKNLELWNDFAKSIDDMACKAESTLQGSGDNPLKEMARIISEAQRILKELNLSTPMIDEIISVAKQAGVWAGKVSGAGTGGATVLMCAAGESPRISEKLKSKNINVLTVVTSHG